MSQSPHVFDVDDAGFEAAVVQRSHDVPVVVDFWAEWCGPCRTLGPLLEQAVDARGGQVLLAKVDVDANQRIAQAFNIQGIPAVKAFRDGRIVDEFTGAQPGPAIEAFLDRVVPSLPDQLAARARDLMSTDPDAAAAAAREALEHTPSHRGAAVALAELLLEEDPQQSLDLVTPHRPIPEAEAVATRAELALASGGADASALAERVAADPEDADARIELARVQAGDGDYEAAIDQLLDLVADGGDAREPAREQLVGLFNVLGDDHELVRTARPRLARALF